MMWEVFSRRRKDSELKMMLEMTPRFPAMAIKYSRVKAPKCVKNTFVISFIIYAYNMIMT